MTFLNIRQSSQNFRKSAFTLVEMLIVIGIITILMGLGAASIMRIAQGSNVKQAEVAMMGKLSAARSIATSKNTYIAVVFPIAQSTPEDLASRCAILCEVEPTGLTGTKSFKPKAFIPGQSWTNLPPGTLVLAKVTGTEESSTGTLITQSTDGFVEFSNSPASSAATDEKIKLRIGHEDLPAKMPAIVFGPSGQPETNSLTGVILYVAEGRISGNKVVGNVANHRLLEVNPFTGRIKVYEDQEEANDDNSN